MRRFASVVATAALVAAACVAARADDAPPSFGGRYPHLAVSNSSGKCGIGAVVLWAVGWDEKSVILLVRSAADAAAGRDPWHVFRLPKACNSYDGDHGWHTEWPRIREVVPAAEGRPARYLLTMHGRWYEFPGTFSAESTGGITPLCSHLKITGDVAPWTIGGAPRIVFGCDDAAKSGFKSEQQNPRNDLTGRSNSNLWFTTWDGLGRLGMPAGVGYVWRHETVRAGVPSDPFLLAGGRGTAHRIIHLAHEADAPVTFALVAGADADWKPVATVTVPARGSAFHVLPADVAGDWFSCVTLVVQPGQPRGHEFPGGFSAQWVRFTTDTDCRATGN